MGFRDLKAFNLALVAKQTWKIVQNPKSLLARIYKRRYYNSSTSSTSFSYGWKSIQEGKNLLQKGLVLQVRDGINIRVLEDFWLPGVPPRRLVSPCSHPNMIVSEIINHSTATWNVDKLNALFQHEDVDLKFNLSDQYGWPYTTNLEYTVKSGYWTITHDFMDANTIIPPEGSLVLKAQIWKLEILSKI